MHRDWYFPATLAIFYIAGLLTGVLEKCSASEPPAFDPAPIIKEYPKPEGVHPDLIHVVGMSSEFLHFRVTSGCCTNTIWKASFCATSWAAR